MLKKRVGNGWVALSTEEHEKTLTELHKFSVIQLHESLLLDEGSYLPTSITMTNTIPTSTTNTIPTSITTTNTIPTSNTNTNTIPASNTITIETVFLSDELNQAVVTGNLNQIISLFGLKKSTKSSRLYEYYQRNSDVKLPPHSSYFGIKIKQINLLLIPKSIFSLDQKKCIFLRGGHHKERPIIWYASLIDGTFSNEYAFLSEIDASSPIIELVDFNLDWLKEATSKISRTLAKDASKPVNVKPAVVASDRSFVLLERRLESEIQKRESNESEIKELKKKLAANESEKQKRLTDSERKKGGKKVTTASRKDNKKPIKVTKCASSTSSISSSSSTSESSSSSSSSYEKSKKKKSKRDGKLSKSKKSNKKSNEMKERKKKKRCKSSSSSSDDCRKREKKERNNRNCSHYYQTAYCPYPNNDYRMTAFTPQPYTPFSNASLNPYELAFKLVTCAPSQNSKPSVEDVDRVKLLGYK